MTRGRSSRSQNPGKLFTKPRCILGLLCSCLTGSGWDGDDAGQGLAGPANNRIKIEPWFKIFVI